MGCKLKKFPHKKGSSFKAPRSKRWERPSTEREIAREANVSYKLNRKDFDVFSVEEDARDEAAFWAK